MAFNHDSPYSSPPHPLASRKAQVVPVLTPAALKVRKATGLPVWWHPAGPVDWLPPSAVNKPLVIISMEPTIRAGGTVVRVRRADNQPVATRSSGTPLLECARCIDSAGLHVARRLPVFTDQPPSTTAAPKQAKRTYTKDDRYYFSGAKEQGSGMPGPHGTAAEQEEHERFGPLYKHDPGKHCRKCGMSGGCKCPREEQVE